MKQRQLLSIVTCLFFLLVTTQGFSQEIDNEDIQVCHATNSASNPYNLFIVDANSIANDPNGHGEHEDDIIPPFTYSGGSFPGLNWTPSNILIWENGCAIPQTITLDVKIFLQGTYDATSGEMHTNLTDVLPLEEPYSAMGFAELQNAAATTKYQTLVDYEIVDWVMVELKESNGNNSNGAKLVGLATKTGTVVAMDGVSPLVFKNIPADDYYVITHHRNHLSVSTATPLSLPNDSY